MTTNDIFRAKTEHGYEIRTLFNVLKEVLQEVPIQLIRDVEQPAQNNKKDKSEKSEEKQKKETKKKKNKNESDDDSESEKEEEEEEPKKKSNGGIRILALDDHKTLMVYVKLNANEFTEFYVKYPVYDIGLDLTHLDKFLKSVEKDSIMTISIDEDDDQYIVFQLQNSVKSNSSAYKQRLLDIDNEQKKIPQETNFEMSVMMETQEFRKICSDMNQFSEYVEIRCTSKEITFKCQGDSNALIKTYKNSENGVKILTTKNIKSNTIVQAIYNLKHLVTFGKCVNLCNEMQLFLKNDYPLFIHYTVGSLGKMLVGLSPVDEKTIKQGNDYDAEKMDKYYADKKIIMKK